MSFTVADIPAQMPDTFGPIFARIGEHDPERLVFDREHIHSLTLMADDSVARTHRLLNLILDYDVRWRTSVFQGDTEYDQAIQDRIESGLRFWADSTEALLAKIDALQHTGFRPISLDTLRPRVTEVRSMLTPDDEFFRGEELDDLARAAIDENEAGHATAFQVMGE